MKDALLDSSDAIIRNTGQKGHFIHHIGRYKNDYIAAQVDPTHIHIFRENGQSKESVPA